MWCKHIGRIFSLPPDREKKSGNPVTRALHSRPLLLLGAVALVLMLVGSPEPASAQTYQSTKDFNTLDAAGNNAPEAIWSDGETMWVGQLRPGDD